MPNHIQLKRSVSFNLPLGTKVMQKILRHPLEISIIKEPYNLTGQDHFGDINATFIF